MNYKNNGFLIQQRNRRNIFVEKYMQTAKYHGVHEFITFPLSCFDKDPQCRKLNEKQTSKKISEDEFLILEFMSDVALLQEYLQKMRELDLPCRLLYVESQYDMETCEFVPENKTFLGYEVCEIPFDPWTLLDLFSRTQFKRHHDKLNENGLFSCENDAIEFMEEYKDLLSKGLVGDGDVDLYICRVYEVALE